jgi:hypothetical protein
MIPIESSGTIINANNRQFDKQISYEIRQQQRNGNHEFVKVYSSIMKDIFNLTIDFDTDDWRNTRTPKFWERYNSLRTDYEKKAITLEYIKAYLRRRN